MPSNLLGISFFTGDEGPPAASFLERKLGKELYFCSTRFAPCAGIGLGVAVGVLLLSFLLRPSVFLKAGAFRATLPTHGRVAGEVCADFLSTEFLPYSVQAAQTTGVSQLCPRVCFIFLLNEDCEAIILNSEFRIPNSEFQIPNPAIPSPLPHSIPSQSN